MSSFIKLNKNLEKAFNGKVNAALRNDILYLTGKLQNWEDIVRAGYMSVNKKKYTVVNDIEYTSRKIPPMNLPAVASNIHHGKHTDVLIIGAGIVGCAIARELSRYKLDVVVVEKEHDVALHASGRNDGVIHPGLDLRKGQLKKKYCDAGNIMYPDLCKNLDVPFKYTGQYLCFTYLWIKPFAFLFLLYWKYMGVSAQYISRKKLLQKEPNLSDKVKFALFFPTTGVVCPHNLTAAYAENAINNGVKIFFDTAVIGMDVSKKKINSVLTNNGRIYPKLVINAAGVFTEDIARYANDRFFSIHPRCGTNMILDKKTASLVNTIVSTFSKTHVISSKTKGALSKEGGIIHTLDGNLLIGPNAKETYEKENFSTHIKSIKNIFLKQQKLVPDLCEKDIITYYTGIRAATYEEDFYISFGKYTENIIHAAGIQSPGLTAAPAIAADISKMAANYLKAGINDRFNPVRKANIRLADLQD
jgi:glycerol-3-phosphate dehydrogenase